jgi:hypothetical protein
MECMLLRTFSIEVAYLGGVYMIVILKAWQVSKGQQSLTKLNANTSNIYLSGFPILACMAVVGI